MMVDKLYNLFEKSIPDYTGKICVPISGGLDSRVLAGLISKKRKIDLSYCQYFSYRPRQTSYKDVEYAAAIAKICGVERFIPILTNGSSHKDLEAIEGLPLEENLKKSMMYTGVRMLNNIVNLKDYTIVSGHMVDIFTGVGVTPFTLFSYKKKDDEIAIKRDQYYGYGYGGKGIFQGTYGAFAKWDCPLWNQELIDFCLNLPIKYRFLQYLYRQMIQKYFPELAKIPRSGMNVSMDIGEVKYFIERIKYWMAK